MEIAQSFINSYLNFHYGLGFAIAVIIFAILLCIKLKKCKSQGQSISWKGVLCLLTLSVYLVIILGGTLLNRTFGESATYRIEWVPFWSYYDVIVNRTSGLGMQMFYNVLVFIAWGILMPQVWSELREAKWLIGSAALFSLSIEIVQFVFKLGLFEFDDVFHNALGAVIGFGVWKAWKKWRKIR